MKGVAQILQTINIMFLELVNDPAAVSEFPVTPGLATTEFTSHFIKNYNSFPGYEINIFYRGVPIGSNEKEVSLLQF